MRRKLLWVGDAGCPSGFAVATHKTLETLCKTYDVTVLGINYRGDPHNYSYPIYTAAAGGDWMGVKRLIWMCDTVQPDIVVLQNDVWNIPAYVKQMKNFKEYENVPIVGALAVDGKNCQGLVLNELSHAIFWTQFGLDEARDGGMLAPASVIPLGVDTNVFYPIDKAEARSQRLTTNLDDKFIVGRIDRNQPRKRHDLLIKYFAEWVKGNKIEDAYLYLHLAPTGDTGVVAQQLANYYGVLDRLILMEPPVWYGVSEEELRVTYNCFDVMATTTQGEGFHLPTMEGAACGIPQIVPGWAALGELWKDAAWIVPCSTTHVGPPYVNVIGGVPDQQNFMMALNRMYRDKEAREENGRCALARARESRFQWENIGKKFQRVLDDILDARDRKRDALILGTREFTPKTVGV